MKHINESKKENAVYCWETTGLFDVWDGERRARLLQQALPLLSLYAGSSLLEATQPSYGRLRGQAIMITYILCYGGAWDAVPFPNSRGNEPIPEIVNWTKLDWPDRASQHCEESMCNV